MKNEKIEEILHPRILRHCRRLFLDGHYAQASVEAYKQLDGAMHEKTGSSWFGRRLSRMFEAGGKKVLLRTPFGSKMQAAAAAYFDGAYQYYRNYAVHEGDKIDRLACLRSLVAASELLELVGASDLSYQEIGGLEGLVGVGAFSSKGAVIDLLRFLDGQPIVDEVVDGFFEDLAQCGFDDRQLRALFDVGLIAYEVTLLPQDPRTNPDQAWDIGAFEITPLGRQAIEEAAGV